jgi:hypothetical protein
MTTPVTTLPPSSATTPLREPTTHPDFYDTIPFLGCGLFSLGCYVSDDSSMMLHEIILISL